jgi:hypothetical protein
VDNSDPSQLAQCCPKRVVKAAKFLKISLVQLYSLSQAYENASQSGEGWRLAHSDNPSHFAAVEAVSPYSKRTDDHGGIERDIILKQMDCAATGCSEASQVAMRPHARLRFSDTIIVNQFPDF